MNSRAVIWLLITLLAVVSLGACAAPAPQPTTPRQAAAANPTPLKVVAVETFLADMAQNVAGDRLKVESLIPIGVDPHMFEATPQDVVKLAQSQVLIINGAGFETWLEDVLENAGGQRAVITASAGLIARQREGGETAHEEEETAEEGDSHGHHDQDPHFWLDPIAAIKYVENIRDGLSAQDPAGRETYAANAEAYIAELKDLHQWILEQVATIPPERRLLVTNHESFGYFADRYGFTVVGTVIPGVSTGASPSAQEMAALVEHIREAGAVAIFLETGSNPQLARQITHETGVRVVTELFTHSITDASGPAPTYIEMMRHNVRTIVASLK